MSNSPAKRANKGGFPLHPLQDSKGGIIHERELQHRDLRIVPALQTPAFSNEGPSQAKSPSQSKPKLPQLHLPIQQQQQQQHTQPSKGFTLHVSKASLQHPCPLERVEAARLYDPKRAIRTTKRNGGYNGYVGKHKAGNNNGKQGRKKKNKRNNKSKKNSQEAGQLKAGGMGADNPPPITEAS